jgi:HNH endonuclease
MGRLRWYAKEEILDRDQFSCQICQSSASLEIHHIRHWSKGGEHNPANLITLCSHCHGVVHHELKHIITSGQNPLELKEIIINIQEQNINFLEDRKRFELKKIAA